MLLVISFIVAFLVWKVQKNKAVKAESTEKCPYHNLHENEDVVGYETHPPSPIVDVVKAKPAAKKKAVTKKTATKKANSSRKKK